MDFTDREKELLLSNAPVLSRITLYGENGEVLQVFNENDYLVDWDYEDFRYVPNQGFIGQFVERLLDGHLMNVPEGISLENKEISVEIAVVDSTLQNQVYHNYGRFIITKVEQEDTTGSYKFESSDYTKKFNVAFKGEEVTYPCTALELLNHACNQAGVKLNSGKNLFDKNKPNDIACSMASNGISNSSQAKTIYVPIESGKTYTISKIQSARFRVGTTQDIPAANVTVSDYVSRDNATSITITASTGAKYLVAYVYISTDDTKIYQDILDNIQIEESYTATTYESYPELTYSYCISEDGLEAGNYYFKDGDSYYNFTISENLRLRDSLMLVGDKIVQRKVTDDYKIVETDIYYTVGNSGTGTELECSKVPYVDFTNNNFVIEDNQFEEQDSCRTVVTSIAKLSYTWARINEDNVLKLDFAKKVEGNTDSYNEIDTNKYYEATTTGDNVQPVNKVLIGMSNVEGENIVNEVTSDSFDLNSMEGNTYQNSAEGKNLCGIPNQTTTFKDVKITINDGEITLNGTSTGSGVVQFDAMFPTVLNGSYVSNFIYVSGTTSVTQGVGNFNIRNIDETIISGTQLSLNQYNSSASFTVSSDTSIKYGIYIQSTNITFTNYKFKIQLVKGTSADYNWVSYQGGYNSPNDRFPQDIKRVGGNNYLKIYGKNILNNANVSETINGITFTKNEDGSVLVNGTATGLAAHHVNVGSFVLPAGNYYLSGCPTGGSNDTYRFDINGGGAYADYGNGKSINLSSDYTVNNVRIRIASGATINNLLFKPMIEKGTQRTDYEPYKEQLYSIDLPVENLFNKDDYIEANGTISDASVSRFTGGGANYAIVLPCKANTTYTVQKRNDGNTNRFALASCEVIPDSTTSVMTSTHGNIRDDNGKVLTITTTNTDHYLIIQYYRTAESLITKQDLLDSIQVEKGSNASAYVPFNLVPIGYNMFTPFDRDTVTTNGIEFTYSKNGYINCDGTATATARSMTSGQATPYLFELKPGTYTLSGGNEDVTLEVIDEYGTSVYSTSYSRFGTFTNTSTKNVFIRVSIANGTTVENVKIYPRLETGNISTAYTHSIQLNKIDNTDKIFQTNSKNKWKSYMWYKTSNQVSYTFSNDGSILVNGTANGASFSMYTAEASPYMQYLNPGIYTLSGGSNKVQLKILDESGNSLANTTAGATSISFVLNSRIKVWLRCEVGNTIQVDNEIIRPMIEEGSSVTAYEPYGNGDWWLYKVNNCFKLTQENTTNMDKYLRSFRYRNSIIPTTNSYCSHFTDTGTGWTSSDTSYIGKYTIKNQAGMFKCMTIDDITLDQFKEFLDCNDVELIYAMNSPEYHKITYQPLIDQLNSINENAHTYDNPTYAISRGTEINSPLQITVTDIDGVGTSYTGEDITITNGHEYEPSTITIYDNPLTHSEALRRIAINGSEKLFGLRYTPMEVNSIGHPWLNGNEFMKVTNLEEQDLYFYPFDRKMTYKGYLETTLSAQSKNEVAQKYENKNTIIDRVHHTEIDVDKANGQISLISTQTDENTSDISNLIVTTTGISTNVETIQNTTIPTITGDIDTINNNITNMNSEINDINNNQLTSIVSRLSQVEQTAEAITNMFQITGGINTIRNSAFLLSDAVWEFTNNGTNPYYTPLGSSYNVALSGSTTSVAEIKLRSVKVKSKSENITNLKIGTKYTFNFYHKQDNNMTTTIKMYSTENNSSKAFNDITISGQQSFKNYEVSFTPTTYSNYTLEIIVSSTASVGYSYIYDLMLNAGDKQSWQPASDEIYSTTLTMSRLGLQVYSVGDGTITVLGSDGLASYETTDGRTRGRLVSQRTVDGDITRSNTTQSVYLTSDILNESASKWIETIIILNGRPSKVEYLESGQ